MTFKDQAAIDLNVFINVTEFADDHTINGAVIRCVVDENINQERTSLVSVPVDGVCISIVSIFVKTADFNYRPVQGEYMTLDNVGYYVVSCSETAGVMEIKLRANVS